MDSTFDAPHARLARRTWVGLRLFGQHERAVLLEAGVDPPRCQVAVHPSSRRPTAVPTPPIAPTPRSGLYPFSHGPLPLVAALEVTTPVGRAKYSSPPIRTGG